MQNFYHQDNMAYNYNSFNQPVTNQSNTNQNSQPNSYYQTFDQAIQNDGDKNSPRNSNLQHKNENN